MGNNFGITAANPEGQAMTMTVKLAPSLEQSLRRRSAALGRPASELIREALQAYLDTAPVSRPASTRKRVVVDIWADKHSRRDAKPRRG
jgi:Ribbon-helix-helix protein, copG family